MRLIWHIVGKDLRRLRTWVALWAVTLVAKVGLGWFARGGDFAVGDWARLKEAVGMDAGIDGLLVYFLTLLLVQEDAAVGAGPFWVTRPISGRRMFFAKLAAILSVLIGLPVLISLPWWLTCGYGIPEILAASLETLATRLVVILPAAVVAVLTDSLGRALLWSLVLGAVVVTGGAFWTMLIERANSELVGSRVLITLVVLAVTAVITMGGQYFTRRHVRSMAGAIGGLLVAFAVMFLWPWDFSPAGEPIPEPGQRETNRALSKDVTVEVKGSFLRTRRNDPEGEAAPTVEIRLRMQGVPDSLALFRGEAVHTWRWTDGLTFVREGGGWPALLQRNAVRSLFGLGSYEDDPETRRFRDERRAARGLPPLAQSTLKPKEAEMDYWVSVPRAFARRVQRDPPAYRLRAWYALLQPRLLLELPVREGASAGSNGRGLRIMDAKFENDDGVLNAISTRFDSLWRRGRDYFFRDELARGDDESFYYLVDRRHGHIHDSWNESNATRDDLEGLRIDTVQVKPITLRFTGARAVRSGRWVARWPDWRESIDIALVDFREVARFTRDATTPRFEIQQVIPMPGP